MLTIESGKTFVANYSENGHVTKDVLSPNNGPRPGNYTWYLAATDSTDENPLATYGAALQTGRVIASGDFDDGKCAEDATKGRAGPRQCQSSVTLPSTLSAGTYELIWLWDFPKVDGVVEMYSSCMDITVVAAVNVVDTTVANQAVAVAESSVAGVTSAVTQVTSTSSQRTRTSIAFVTTVIYTTVQPGSDDPSLESTTTTAMASSTTTTELSTTAAAVVRVYASVITTMITVLMTGSTTSTSTTPTRTTATITTSSVSSSTIQASGYVTSMAVVQEVSNDPLVDANNMSVVTRYEVVTVTM